MPPAPGAISSASRRTALRTGSASPYARNRHEPGCNGRVMPVSPSRARGPGWVSLVWSASPTPTEHGKRLVEPSLSYLGPRLTRTGRLGYPTASAAGASKTARGTWITREWTTPKRTAPEGLRRSSAGSGLTPQLPTCRLRVARRIWLGSKGHAGLLIGLFSARRLQPRAPSCLGWLLPVASSCRIGR